MNRFLLNVLLAVSIGATSSTAQTLRERIQPYLERSLAAGNAFAAVSAASGAPAVAPGSLACLLGANLASQTQTGSAPYPTSLGGVGLQIVDSAGKSEALPLLYVSSGQINALIPANIAAGAATINIVNGTGNVPSGTVQVQAVSPALFTANGDGQGVVAATAYATAIPTTITGPVTVFQCGSAPGSCVSVPIDPGVDRPVTITLYATGLRGRSSDSAVILTIGSTNVPIQSITPADDTGPLAGIDQVTFGLSLNLRGAGEVDIFLTVDGVESNHGRINIQ
jgi:uncharacterized protein (TIGR03437 family)